MAHNSIRRGNNIEAHRLGRIFAFILVLTVIGIAFAFIQVRNIKLADEIKNYEQQLAEIEQRNSVLQLEIERRMKPRALQARISEFDLNLVHVSQLETVEAPMRASYTPQRAYVRAGGVR